MMHAETLGAEKNGLQDALEIAHPIRRVIFWQSLVTLLVFLLMCFWSTSIFSPERIFVVTIWGASDFFSAVSQTLGALVGFFLAFLIFLMQSLSVGKNNNFFTLENSANRLYDISLDCPEQLHQMFPELHASIEFLQMLELKDFPLHSKKLKSLRDVFNKIKAVSLDELDVSGQLFVRQLIWIYNDVEIGIHNLNVHHVGFEMILHVFPVVPKLLFLIGFALFMLIPIGMIDVDDFVPDLLMPIVISFSFLLAWILLEFYRSLKYLLGRFIESWRWA